MQSPKCIHWVTGLDQKGEDERHFYLTCIFPHVLTLLLKSKEMSAIAQWENACPACVMASSPSEIQQKKEKNTKEPLCVGWWHGLQTFTGKPRLVRELGWGRKSSTPITCVLTLIPTSIHRKDVGVGSEFHPCPDRVNWCKVPLIVEAVIWCVALVLT